MTTLDRAGRTAVVGGGVALLAFAFVSLVVGLPATSTAGGTGAMSGMGMGGGMAVRWGVLVLLAVLPLVAVLAFGYAGIRVLTGDEATGTVGADDEADPIARLQRRYAEGELTEAEFERALDRELGDGTDQGRGGGGHAGRGHGGDGRGDDGHGDAGSVEDGTVSDVELDGDRTGRTNGEW
jgi:uncharacterized membrane protein